MSLPVLTVIIPVRNEQAHIARCMESVFAMQNIDRAEVLVIDGMSNDGTREELAALTNTFPSLAVMDNPAKKVTSALNLGIAHARSGIIMRLDAHAIYAPDYITACLQVMEKTGAANVGGHAFALPGENTLTAHAIALAHHSPFGLGGASFRSIGAQGKVETVWPGCFRKEALDAAGPVNEPLERSEDIELNYRIRKAGYGIYLSPEIKLWYFCRPTIPALFTQRFLDGAGIIDTLRVNPGAVRLRHLAPLAAMLAGLSVLLWTGLSLVLGSKAAFAAACAAMATGASAWTGLAVLFSIIAWTQVGRINRLVPFERRRIRKNAALLLPLVFATLHLAYAMGSLKGMVIKKDVG